MINNKCKILVINSGMGNIGSLINALIFLDFDVHQMDKFDGNESLNFDGFILPGVGSFPSGIRKMREAKLDQLVLKLIDKEVAGIGICLGMQLLADYSLEGNIKSQGLSIFSGSVEKLVPSKNDKVPHIGWTETQLKKFEEPWQNILNNAFYYVHSYAVRPKIREENLATISHSGKNITSAIYKNKILGVQFHPEKSQQQGLKLLNEFFLFHA